MVAASNGQEAYEWDLHAGQSPQGIPCRLAHVEPGTEPSHADQDKSMQGQQIGDEHVSAPGADHVSVEQGTKASPHRASLFHGFDP